MVLESKAVFAADHFQKARLTLALNLGGSFTAAGCHYFTHMGAIASNRELEVSLQFPKRQPLGSRLEAGTRNGGPWS